VLVRALLLLFVLAGSALAQNAPTEAKSTRRIPEPLMCDRLTIADGLPIGHVNAMVQDQLGFMWIGTPEGLVRYDGLRMKKYTRQDNDPASISSDKILSLGLAADGKMWVGTEDRGASLYDPKTDKFTRFEPSEQPGGLNAPAVSAIVRDKKDRMWFATGNGLYRFDEATKKFVAYQNAPLDVGVASLAVDDAGDLWLAAGKDGAIKWSPDANKSTVFDQDKLDVDSTIVDVMVSSTGKVWLGSESSGVVIIDPKSGALSHMRHSDADASTIGSDAITRVFEAANKSVWIGTQRGVNRVESDGKITRYDNDDYDPTSIAFPATLSIYQDRGGVLYFGGWTVGICKVVEAKLQFGYHRTRTGDYATSFWEDTDGTLWVATYKDGLYKYDRKNHTQTVYTRFEKRMDGKEGVLDLTTEAHGKFAMQRDKKGILWIAITDYGLVGFDTKNETYKDYHPDPNHPEEIPEAVAAINDIWEDSQGMLWLATATSHADGGLLRFDPATEDLKTFKTTDNIGLTSDAYYQLVPQPSEPNILWLATYGGGLVRFDLNAGKATAFRAKADDPASLSSDTITSIVFDPDGTLWLGTSGGGLDHLDTKTNKAERYTPSNSALTNSTIYGLIRDDSGKLWLGTNGGGLVEFDPKTRAFRAYTFNDGAQDEFNQCAFLKTASGELLFGGPRGWNGFHPNGITQDKYVPPVVLTSYKLGNQDGKLSHPIWTLPSLKVTYSDSFELEFASLAFAAPEKNRFSYKLEGYDDSFKITERPYATYQKLPPGKYKLHVRASNQDGQWNDAGVTIALSVTPPFWRSWGAFVVYILLIGAAAFAVFNIQRERVRRAEREGRLAVVERDLELSGAVQTGFLPEMNEIATEHVQVHGFYRPADACGGDWWWHEPLMGGRHIVMVGDVTGHGPGPAMVTAAVATAFRVMIDNGLDDAEQALHMLNREVLRVAKGKYHMTMAALELNETTGKWVLYNAGAPPIMSLSAAGKHRVHFCPGAPLGTENGFEVGRVEGQLQPTERILIYTDGIPEIILPNGNVLGMRRFAQLYEKTRSQSLRDVAASIIANSDQTRGTEPQLDDWTFTILQWN
jgi:ligand-binding sensor domain-containing protein/serine phosphatase RsbU (regulator of sigma subunit)